MSLSFGFDENGSSKFLQDISNFASVVVGIVAIFALIIVATIFIVVFRRRQIRSRGALVGYLMELLSYYSEPQGESEKKYDGFFAYYSGDGPQLDRDVISKLRYLNVKIATEEDFEYGSCRLDNLLDIKTYRCIVLVLSPEFMTDGVWQAFTTRALIARCAIVPLVYRSIDAYRDNPLFSDIIDNHSPIYWPQEPELQDRAVNELRQRLTTEIITRIVRMNETTL